MLGAYPDSWEDEQQEEKSTKNIMLASIVTGAATGTAVLLAKPALVTGGIMLGGTALTSAGALWAAIPAGIAFGAATIPAATILGLTWFAKKAATTGRS